jgi:hypothetical protein
MLLARDLLRLEIFLFKLLEPFPMTLAISIARLLSEEVTDVGHRFPHWISWTTKLAKTRYFPEIHRLLKKFQFLRSNGSHADHLSIHIPLSTAE